MLPHHLAIAKETSGRSGGAIRKKTSYIICIIKKMGSGGVDAKTNEINNDPPAEIIHFSASQLDLPLLL